MISLNAHRHTVQTEIPEGTTPRLTLQLLDEDGVGVPATVMTGLTLTLSNERSNAIVNARNHQSVLNVNGGSVDEQGHVSLALTPADTAILDDTRATEMRIALLEWAWTDGVAKAGKCEIAFVVRNLTQVP